MLRSSFYAVSGLNMEHTPNGPALFYHHHLFNQRISSLSSLVQSCAEWHLMEIILMESHQEAQSETKFPPPPA